MAGASQPPRRPVTPDVLLRNCLTLSEPVRRRAPASIRLEQALGRDLAHRLLRRITVNG